MEDSALFILDGIALRVYPRSYLVEVRNADENTGPESDWTDVPDWVFRSSRAIWLTVENAPMMRRAQRGDQIRRRLMSVWIRHNGKAVV